MKRFKYDEFIMMESQHQNGNRILKAFSFFRFIRKNI